MASLENSIISNNEYTNEKSINESLMEPSLINFIDQ